MAFCAVLDLRLLVLLRDHEAGRQVGDADRRVGGVDALPAGAARAERVDAQILRLDLDVDLLGLGQHRHRRRRRVDAAARLGRRHALHAMHAALVLQEAVDALALDRRDHFLDAAAPGLADDSTSSFQPRRSANREYIRKRSPANSAASSPPVPARISSTTFLSSLGSLGVSRTRSVASSSAMRAFEVRHLFGGERRQSAIAARSSRPAAVSVASRRCTRDTYRRSPESRQRLGVRAIRRPIRLHRRIADETASASRSGPRRP